MHPTIGPNATKAGAIALYNLIQDAVYFAPESVKMHAGIGVDHMADIPDTKRGAAVGTKGPARAATPPARSPASIPPLTWLW